MLEGFNDYMNQTVKDDQEIIRQYGPGLNSILQARIDANVAAIEDHRNTYLQGYFQKFPLARQTESGLVYHELEAGTGASPTPESTVYVHYQGKFLDGKIFDSSIERGEPINFPLKHVIQGWQEGLLLMKVGGKAQLVVPPNLGYGEKGAPPTIPPNASLIFDVHLLSVE